MRFSFNIVLSTVAERSKITRLKISPFHCVPVEMTTVYNKQFPKTITTAMQ